MPIQKVNNYNVDIPADMTVRRAMYDEIIYRNVSIGMADWASSPGATYAGNFWVMFENGTEFEVANLDAARLTIDVFIQPGKDQANG